MATKYQYIHINSEERATRAVIDPKKGDEATIKVSVAGHQIRNIKNVAVKQFSINNSLFNITVN